MTAEEKYYQKITLDFITSLVKEEVLKHGYYKPTMIIEGTEGTVCLRIPVFSDTPAKSTQAMHVLGKGYAKSGEVGKMYQGFAMGKTLMSVHKDTELIKTLSSQGSNRKEVFVVSSLKIQGQVKSVKLFEIIRNDQGKLVDLQEFLPDIKEGEMPYIPFLEAFSEGLQMLS